MTEQVQVKKNPWLTLWIAIRFVIFGVGGFVTLWIGFVSLMIPFDHLTAQDPWTLVGFPLIPAGGLMMSFGSGMWKRWAYLWVFFSIPLVITSLWLLVDKYPAAESLFATPVLILLVAMAMPVSYWLVRKYYKRREAPQPSSAPAPQITTNEEGSL